MATPGDIKELRGLVGEPDDENGWSDVKLGTLLDNYETVNAAARQVWLNKAAQAALLVNVSESGSSRNLGDIRKNAMEMAAYFGNLDTTEIAEVTSVPVISRIRRGFS